MADVRLSNLAAAVAANLDGNSLVPTTDSEGTITTVKVTLGQMRTALLTRANGNYAATDYLSLGGAAPPSTGWIRVDGTTVTASTPILNAIQTWNQGATVFTGLLVQITNTASSASSLLMDYQVGGFSKWKVDVAGNATAAGNANVQALTATTGLFTAALTYGGVTLSNAVTGTGNMVLSASPTLTGTLTGALANFSDVISGTTVSLASSVNTGASDVLSNVNTGSAAQRRFAFTNNVGAARGIFGLTGGNFTPSGGQLADGMFLLAQGAGGLSLGTFAAASTAIYYNNTLHTTFGASGAVAFTGALSGITTLAIGGAFTGATTGAFSGAVTSTLASGTSFVIANNTAYGTKTTGGSGVRLLTADNLDHVYLGSVDAGFSEVHLRVNGVDHTTFGASGAVTFTAGLSGITTLAGTGAISGFTSANFSGGVYFAKDSLSVNNGVVVHIAKGTGAGLYLLTALGSGGGTAFSYLLTFDGASTTSVVALVSNVNWTVAAGTGSDLTTITNASGGTLTLTYSVTRLYS